MKSEKKQKIYYGLAGATIALLLMAVIPAQPVIVTPPNSSGLWLGISFQDSILAKITNSAGTDVSTKSMALTLNGKIATSGGTPSSWSISGNLKITSGTLFRTVPISASGTGTPPLTIPIKINNVSPYLIPMSDFKTFWGTAYGTKVVSFAADATLTVNFSDGTTASPSYTNVNLGSVTFTYTSDATAVLTLDPIVPTTQALIPTFVRPY